MPKVKNINGTSNRTAPAGYTSWLDYWEKKASKKAYVCHAHSCSRTDLVGAHVKKVEGSDNSWYIVPICKECNKATGDFNVIEPLVAVNPM